MSTPTPSRPSMLGALVSVTAAALLAIVGCALVYGAIELAVDVLPRIGGAR